MRAKSPQKPPNPAVLAAMIVGIVVALGSVVFNTVQMLSPPPARPASNPTPAPAAGPSAPATETAQAPEPAVSGKTGANEVSPTSPPAKIAPDASQASGASGVSDAFLSGSANPFAPLPKEATIIAKSGESDSGKGVPPLGKPSASPGALLPFPNPETRPVTAALKPPSLPVLLGTLHSEDPAALLKHESRTVLAGVGECVGEWEIERILPGKVLLRRGSRNVLVNVQPDSQATKDATGE